MLDMLLWRCPLCATNDAIHHSERRFRPDWVACRQCRARWRLHRHPGRGFSLELVEQPAGGSGFSAGDVHPLPVWYDAMKATLRLTPLYDPGAPLAAGETLYLTSQSAMIEVEEDDPLFGGKGTPGPPRLDKAQVRSRMLGPGRLYLSDRRLLWQQPGSGGSPPPPVSLPLSRLRTAWIMFQLILMVDMRLYLLEFRQESVLKWLTYLHGVCVLHRPDRGRGVKFSHF